MNPDETALVDGCLEHLLKNRFSLEDVFSPKRHWARYHDASIRLWSLWPVCGAPPPGVGIEDYAGSAVSRFEQLCNINTRRGSRGPRSLKQADQAVYSKIATEYQSIDPLLVMWGAWLKNRKTPLAYGTVRLPATPGSTAYNAMAARFRVYRNPEYEIRWLRGKVLSQKLFGGDAGPEEIEQNPIVETSAYWVREYASACALAIRGMARGRSHAELLTRWYKALSDRPGIRRTIAHRHVQARRERAEGNLLAAIGPRTRVPHTNPYVAPTGSRSAEKAKDAGPQDRGLRAKGDK